MTQDLHSNGNPDDNDFKYVAPKCPECGCDLKHEVLPKCPGCGGDFKYRVSPVRVSHLNGIDEPMFIVKARCHACECSCRIFVSALETPIE
jgi:hypothetical protein